MTRLTTSIGLCAQSKGNDVGSNTNTAARAAATRVDSQVVGAADLATTAGVTLRVVVAAHISPLAETSLTEEHSTGVAQLADDKGVSRHNVAQEGPAAGTGLQVVLGGDVVLDNEGDAVQRATDLAALALSISLGGNGEGVRVDLDYGTGER